MSVWNPKTGFEIMLCLGIASTFASAFAWTSTSWVPRQSLCMRSAITNNNHPCVATTTDLLVTDNIKQDLSMGVPTRRHVLSSAVLLLPLVTTSLPSTAFGNGLSATSLGAQVTDKVYFTVQGLPSQTDTTISSRIVIGLFGKDAPKCVGQMKQLFSKQGLPRPCRPRAERSLQKEQLEANKVYNACKQAESQGVVLPYSTIWRVVKDEQICVGAVAGKYLAREYPNWNEEKNDNGLRHDTPGVVSVLRGSEGGFGFTIFPGGGDAGELDREYIVVGRILKGMDVIEQLNQVPVITTAKNVNYMALSGTTGTGKAPTRSCRYGGNMYCNEQKPLIKLSISETGIL